MDLKILEERSVEELASDPEQLATVTDEVLDSLDEEITWKVLMARGLVQEKIDSARLELPENDIEILFQPDEEELFADNDKATFFIVQVVDKPISQIRKELRKYDEVDKDSKILILVTPKIVCTYGTCGVNALMELNRKSPNKTFIERGIGSLLRRTDGSMDISWGSTQVFGEPEQPNLENLDYHGPYPSKFADWIRAQITVKFQKTIN